MKLLWFLKLCGNLSGVHAGADTCLFLQKLALSVQQKYFAIKFGVIQLQKYL